MFGVRISSCNSGLGIRGAKTRLLTGLLEVRVLLGELTDFQRAWAVGVSGRRRDDSLGVSRFWRLSREFRRVSLALAIALLALRVDHIS